MLIGQVIVWDLPSSNLVDLRDLDLMFNCNVNYLMCTRERNCRQLLLITITSFAANGVQRNGVMAGGGCGCQEKGVLGFVFKTCITAAGSLLRAQTGTGAVPEQPF